MVFFVLDLLRLLVYTEGNQNMRHQNHFVHFLSISAVSKAK